MEAFTLKLFFGVTKQFVRKCSKSLSRCDLFVLVMKDSAFQLDGVKGTEMSRKWANLLSSTRNNFSSPYWRQWWVSGVYISIIVLKDVLWKRYHVVLRNKSMFYEKVYAIFWTALAALVQIVGHRSVDGTSISCGRALTSFRRVRLQPMVDGINHFTPTHLIHLADVVV